jgi:tRNA G18 (ribose-2'-O)-methylase SpoU
LFYQATHRPTKQHDYLHLLLLLLTLFGIRSRIKWLRLLKCPILCSFFIVLPTIVEIMTRPARTPSKHTRQSPPVLRVRTRDNNFQRAEVIKTNRPKRTRYGQLLVEGVAQINLAVKYGWSIAAFLYPAGRKLSRWANDLLAKNVAQAHWELAPNLLEELSDKDETSEIMAIIEARALAPSVIPPKANGLVVVFDRPCSPGNLGSSIRSADAFGADGIIITGHAADIYDPHVVRGSMGALFTLPVTTAPSHNEVKAWVEQARAAGFHYQIIGSSGKAEHLTFDVDMSKPTVVVLGNETVGMSQGYWEICDSVVKIPIAGALSSINVSCAASILLYEVARQRGRSGV